MPFPEKLYVFHCNDCNRVQVNEHGRCGVVPGHTVSATTLYGRVDVMEVLNQFAGKQKKEPRTGFSFSAAVRI